MMHIIIKHVEQYSAPHKLHISLLLLLLYFSYVFLLKIKKTFQERIQYCQNLYLYCYTAPQVIEIITLNYVDNEKLKIYKLYFTIHQHRPDVKTIKHAVRNEFR